MNTNQFNIVPNKVASDYIRGRVAMSPGVFGRLPDALKARAFTVAAIEDVRVLEEIRDAVARIPEGGDWKKIRGEIAQAIAGDADAGRGHAARAELVMRVNGLAAYAVARHADQVATADIFPYWMYMCNLDGHERSSHARLNGVVLRYDDPFWDTHYPPWEWGCRCYVTKLTSEDAEDYGVANSDALPVPEGDGFNFNPKGLAIDLDSVIDSLDNESDREFARKVFDSTEVPQGEGTQSLTKVNQTPEQAAKPQNSLSEEIARIEAEILRLKEARSKGKNVVPVPNEGNEQVEVMVGKFVPAKSIAQAWKFARDNIADSVLLPDGFKNLALLNKVNRAVFERMQKYNIPKLKYFDAQTDKKDAIATMGTMVSNGTPVRFQFNPKLLSNEEKIYKENVSLYESNGQTRWLAVDKKEDMFNHVIDHEIGHAIYGMNKGTGIHDKIKSAFERAKDTKDIDKISDYAKTNDGEFFSECFARFVAGKDLPDYISDMCKEAVK